MGETWENGVRTAETWINGRAYGGIGRNMGKLWKMPKHGKTVESAETWENGGRTSETWHWSVAKWRKRGKRPEREKPLERENPAERNGGISRKRGKTVAAWPETWENGGRTTETWENGGRTAETGERDQDARFTALQWETAKRRENGGRTVRTC